MERKLNFTFQYPDGHTVRSGGNAGVCIVGDAVDYESIQLGDIVNIVQFNLSGSHPSAAKVVGVHKFDWDMSKPMGRRKSNEVKSGNI